MGGQSPAKVMRSVIRMSKFLEKKENPCSKPVFTPVILLGVDK
jgi:hypothetical protein